MTLAKVFCEFFTTRKVCWVSRAGDDRRVRPVMVEDLLKLTFKVAVASMIAGAVLTHFGITVDVLMKQAGLTPERIQELLQQGIAWALPNMLLGSLVIVPAWLMAILFRPPRRSGE
jgi:hypothetical protein